MTKAFTDIEQSKKLAEILPIESADMWWDETERFPRFVKHYHEYLSQSITPIPCWSAIQLLELIKSRENWLTNLTYILDTYNREGEYIVNMWRLTVEFTYYDKPSIREDIYENDIIDACVEMVCWLFENGYIEKVLQLR